MNEFGEENKKEKSHFPLKRRRSAFGPLANSARSAARFALAQQQLCRPIPTLCLPLTRARSPTAPEHASRVAAMRRRDRHAASPACPVPVAPATPRARLHLPDRAVLPTRLSTSPVVAQQQQLPRTQASSATARASPELAIPATTAHRQPLHLNLSTSSTSRISRSPW